MWGFLHGGTMNKKRMFRRIYQKIKKYPTVFIMGHKDLDLDAIGSALGIYYFVKSCGKDAYIIVNDENHEAGVEKMLATAKDVAFTTSKLISPSLYARSLLFVVDTNKKSLLQDCEIVSFFPETIIFDHHARGEDTIVSENSLILNESSSASEIVTEFFYYFGKTIPPTYASFLLAGITLDTNEFSMKTSSKTHYAAYHLIESGADVSFVNNLLKQDLEEYILRQKVITDTEILQRTIAFAKGSNRIIYRREELAMIADTLLEFNHIETSYVIGKLSDNIVGISARSIGNVDVGEILSILGGGGDRHDAACRIEGKSIKEVETELKKVLGEIE